MIIKFIPGQLLKTSAVSNHETIYTAQVIKRTDKTIVIFEDGKLKRCKIHVFDDVELIYPDGRYSKAPVYKANRVILEQ